MGLLTGFSFISFAEILYFTIKILLEMMKDRFILKKIFCSHLKKIFCSLKLFIENINIKHKVAQSQDRFSSSPV